MVDKAKKAVGVVLLGALGWVGVQVALHLWIDHQALHVLFQIEQARQSKEAPK